MRDSLEWPDRLSPRKLEGRHVLMMFVAFFGLIFAVNGYFLASALSTHTGVVAVEPYRKGLAYNERITASERQAAEGWRDNASIDGAGVVLLQITDSAGVPVDGLTVTGVIGRGASARTDRALVFKSDANAYRAELSTALEPGSWVLTFEARRSSDDANPDYRARRRLWLK